jgi:hypothetical protein
LEGFESKDSCQACGRIEDLDRRDDGPIIDELTGTREPSVVLRTHGNDLLSGTSHQQVALLDARH